MNRSVIAIVGLPGAGKTEAVTYIMGKKNWPKVYFGQAVLDEVKARGLEVNEKNERAVREELRAEHGIGAMAILNMPKIEELLQGSPVVLLESHYSWEEYLILKEKFGDDFKVLAIYASPKTRIARMGNRPERPLTAEELRSRDYSQIENLHQAGPIARADYTIINEDTKEALFANLELALGHLHHDPD